MTKIVHEIDGKTRKPKEKKKGAAVFCKSGSLAVVRIKTSGVICCEKFADVAPARPVHAARRGKDGGHRKGAQAQARRQARRMIRRQCRGRRRDAARAVARERRGFVHDNDAKPQKTRRKSDEMQLTERDLMTTRQPRPAQSKTRAARVRRSTTPRPPRTDHSSARIPPRRSSSPRRIERVEPSTHVTFPVAISSAIAAPLAGALRSPNSCARSRRTHFRYPRELHP